MAFHEISVYYMVPGGSFDACSYVYLYIEVNMYRLPQLQFTSQLLLAFSVSYVQICLFKNGLNYST